MQNDCGMLKVDAQQLKAALLPSPVALLAQLGQIMPQAAARIYNIFIEQLHGATTLLKTSITNVEEYVHQLAFLEECKVAQVLFKDAVDCCFIARLAPASSALLKTFQHQTSHARVL